MPANAHLQLAVLFDHELRVARDDLETAHQALMKAIKTQDKGDTEEAHQRSLAALRSCMTALYNVQPGYSITVVRLEEEHLNAIRDEDDPTGTNEEPETEDGGGLPEQSAGD